MQDMEIKKKVLSEIMDLMDEKDGEMLKMHPKVMAAKIEVAKPESEGAVDMMKEKMMGDKGEMMPGHESSESPEMESEEEMSPEMIKKVLEMYKDIK